MRTRSLDWLSIAAAVGLLGCTSAVGSGGYHGPRDAGGGGGTDSGFPPGVDAGTPPPPPTCPGGGTTSLSGTVTFPNGRLPVPGANVYIPIGDPSSVPHVGACGSCVDMSSVVAATQTDIAGHFVLSGVPAGDENLVVEKGLFRRVTNVHVNSCTDNTPPPDATRLPSDASQGNVPRIAVITGDYDHMEDVLAKLGLAPDAFQIVPGTSDAVDSGTEAASALLADPVRLSNYDIIFVDCGAAVAEPTYYPALNNPAYANNLRTFVQNGGRLYVTDESYDLIEDTYPSAIDFQAGSNGLSSTPQPADAAEVGAGTNPVNATVQDDTLASWLMQNGTLDGSGQLATQGWLDGWAVIRAVDTSHVKVWMSGNVSFYPDTSGYGSPSSAERPLTVTFGVGCGRVLFSSYHTVEGGPGGGGALTGQEQALAYMVLEIGACVQDPAPPLI